MQKNPKQNARTVRNQPEGFRLRRPLTWWRHVVLRDIDGRDRERFLSALRIASAGLLTNTEIEAGIAHGHAALRIAVKLHPYPQESWEKIDLAISWCLLAFLLGQHVAALVIADAVRAIVNRAEGLPWVPTPDTEELVKLRRRMHG